jgi:hypothetical protein
MQRPQRHTTRTGARRLRALGLAALMPLLGSGLLAACGGSDSPSASNSAAKEQSNEQKAEAKFADFARCLREHGVSAEAISHPGGGQGLKLGPGNAARSPATMEAAQQACARYRPEAQRVNLSPQQKVEREEAVQKFARCMREHGIRVEGSAGGGAVRIIGHGSPGSGGPNPESPRFQQAQSACQKLLPGKAP